MGRVRTRTTPSGGSADAPHEYLLGRLETVSESGAPGVQTVQTEGVAWNVVGGIINDPRRSYHEYGIICRRAVVADLPPWYEVEIRNGRGDTVRQYGYGPEGGYQMLDNGVLRPVAPGQYDVMVGVVDRFETSASVGMLAAQELVERADR